MNGHIVRCRVLWVAALFALLAADPTTSSRAHAFYLPGIAPTNYAAGAKLEVMANKLTSPRNQLPYDYFSLPLCNDPSKKVPSMNVNLGQLLVGERSKPTEFEVHMNERSQCNRMCTVTLAEEGANLLNRRIEQMYTVQLTLDNMPVVMPGLTEKGSMAYRFGYPLGAMVMDERRFNVIYNHLRFRILIHRPSQSLYGAARAAAVGTTSGNGEDVEFFRIVGFEVDPRSVDHVFAPDTGELTTCPVRAYALPQRVVDGANITFTYDVDFAESPIEWATRWDTLLNASADLRQVQWFTIANSIMVCVFLSALVGVILLRTLHRDFMRFSQLEMETLESGGGDGALDAGSAMDELSGWRQLHADVFRAPRHAASFCVVLGTGAQVYTMASITLLFALAGFLSPANRGGLLMAMLSLWVLASSVAGYVSARMYSTLEGKASRKLVTMGTAFAFPGATFGMFFMLNLALWSAKSQGAVPFSALVTLLVLWLGLGVPLALAGAYVGYKQLPYQFPMRTNQIPRVIPPTKMAALPYIYLLLPGMIPFFVVFMELVFILNSMWQNQVYYMFGSLLVVFLLLSITSAEMSVVFTYLTLSMEDYRWWWRAICTSGSSGVYMMLYSIYYVRTQPGFEGTTFISLLLYLVYMTIMSCAFALMTGFLGFQASFLFVRKIYAVVRVD